MKRNTTRLILYPILLATALAAAPGVLSLSGTPAAAAEAPVPKSNPRRSRKEKPEKPESSAAEATARPAIRSDDGDPATGVTAAIGTPADDGRVGETRDDGGTDTESAARPPAHQPVAQSAGDPNAPRPRVRPDPARIAEALKEAADAANVKGPPYGFPAAPGLRLALDAVSRDNYKDALYRASRLEDPLDRRLVEWFAARAPDSGMDHQQILETARATAGWPEPERLLLRAEVAFLRQPYTDAEFVAFFRDRKPMTLTGRLADVRRKVLRGEKTAAAAGIRRIWREETFSSRSAVRLAKEFDFALRPEDHHNRLRRLILRRQTNAALTQAALAGKDYASLVKAVIPALRRRRQPERLLKSVSPSLRNDPVFQLAKVRLLRRNGKPVAAAQLLFHTSRDPDILGDPDVWWDERRDLSRQLIDAGQPALAYRVAAEHSAQSEKDRVEAEFHAGWYALRFLNRPQVGKVHFQRVAGLADLPRTISRAHYWLGRAHTASGNEQAATLSHRISARHGATFYGQLSRDILGLAGTGQETAPEITAGDRLRFADNALARAIRRLAAAGHGNRARAFFQALAASSETPGELALTAVLARRIDQSRAILHIATIASRRGFDMGSLNAPLIGIPTQVPVPDTISKAMLYAVSRQESAFNPGAVSHAGARGLMQLMPATARATARSIGYPYSAPRLTRDPAYNATLGAAHLAELMDRLGGSYIMTFAGYNAGQGRAERWARQYGDPRTGAIDPVDWIELIPFDETRDYVQKVMGNLQAYRARLGETISPFEDLARGRPPG